MAPPEVIDYIVVHELAHAVHPNHSADFWALVGTYDPAFREKEAWLDRHGSTLIFDGRHLILSQPELPLIDRRCLGLLTFICSPMIDYLCLQLPPVLDAVVDLRRTYPNRPLVVLVPKVQHGYSLVGGLARRSGSSEGVTAVPPAHFARQIAALDHVLSGASEVLPVGRLFHAADILDRMAPNLQDVAAPGAHHLARTVADAVHTLRLDAVDPERIHEYAAETSTDSTMQIVADGYEAYVDVLGEQNLFDEATTYEWAEQRVRSGQAPGVEDTVFVLLNAVDLPQRAFQFVDALREHGATFVRTGASTMHRAPRESACMRFAEVDVYTADPEPIDPPQSFVRAVGALSEADAVMRDILVGDVPFDDITIAYTTSSPYASLLRDRAERAGIPALSGPGQPALLTQTGRALNQLYEWVRDDFAPPRLVAMLREGMIRFDHWKEAEKEEDGLSPARAATMIAERSYETGRMGLVNGLRRAVRQAEREADEKNTDRARCRLQHQKTVYRLVVELIDLMQPGTRQNAPDEPGGIRIDEGEIHDSVTLEQIAQGSIQFLERFGPVDKTSDIPEEERTLTRRRATGSTRSFWICNIMAQN